MKRTIIAALVLAFSLASPVPVFGEDEAVVLLEVDPVYDYEPVDLEYKITIPPHKDNIWMCWGVMSLDSVIYLRESCEQLNGIYSPRVTYKVRKNLPVGEYQAYVVVYRVPYRAAGSAVRNLRVLEGLG